MKTKLAYVFRHLLIVAFVLGLLACASTDSAPARDSVPFDSGYRTGVLPNGLRYYLRENHKPEKRAYLRLFVRAGSLNESDSERGLAHFVEHMAFNGTERFPKNELVAYLRSLGMRFGPEVNAFTTYDQTVYGIEVPTDKVSVPEKALSVLDDWMSAIAFSPDEVQAERSIILEEYRGALGAMERIREALLPILFRGSRLAERRPIGLPELISSASAEQLSAFYRKWYRPDNMAIAIVGDFDARALEALLKSMFDAPKGTGPLVREQAELPPPQENALELSILSDPELGYGTIHLYFKRTPRAEAQDIAFYRDRLLENLAVQMLRTRFREELARSETPYAAADASMETWGDSSRFFSLSAVPEAGAMMPALEALLLQRESLLRFGFSAGELERGKKTYLSALERAVAEKDKRDSSSLADAVGAHFLKGRVLPSIEWELETARTLLEEVDVTRMRETLVALFGPNDLTAFLICPESERAQLPGEAEIRAKILSIKNAEIAAPVSESVDDRFVAAAPASGRIEARETDKATGALTLRLSNGATVILLRTSNQNDDIRMMALARGGESLVSDADAVSAQYASLISSRSGLGDFAKADIVRKLAGKQVSLSFFTDTSYHGVQGSAVGRDLGTLMELVYLMFTKPRLEEGAYQSAIDTLRTVLGQREQDPDALFSDMIISTVNGNHPRFAPLTTERLGELTLDGVRRFMAKALNPADYTFVFVGTLEEQTLLPLIETWLASIPRRADAPSDWRDLGVRRPGARSVAVRKGSEPKASVFLGWYAPLPYSFADSVAAEVLSEYLDIRLNDTIREERGAVYSIGSELSLEVAPRGELQLMVSYNSDPARADEVAALAQEELARIASGNLVADALEKAFGAVRSTFATNLQSNPFLASTLVTQAVFYREGVAAFMDKAEVLTRLGQADLSRLAKALTGAGCTRVSLLPEN